MAHDQTFKDLLRAFFPEFMDLFFPQVAARLDFSTFQLGDGSSPSNLYMPSVRGWQVDTFTGHASYSLPIDVPAGPAGIRPSFFTSTWTSSPGRVRS